MGRPGTELTCALCDRRMLFTQPHDRGVSLNCHGCEWSVPAVNFRGAVCAAYLRVYVKNDGKTLDEFLDYHAPTSSG